MNVLRIAPLNVSRLKPGMILADDIKHYHTGITLLSAGTHLDPKHLKALELFPTEEECLVYVQGQEPVCDEKEDEKETAAKAPGEGLSGAAPPVEVSPKADREKDLDKRIPMEISQHARQVYLDTYKVVRNFFNKSTLFGEVELGEVRKAASELSSEIVRDPQVLLQIAVLKLIDDYTFSHAVHTSIYAATLAQFLGYSKERVQEICLSALLHDIGKADVPDEILNKPGLLTEDEFRVMKEHVRYSYNRLYRLQDVSRDLLLAIAQHHERMDGSGYLRGLRGTEIHEWARLLAIADVYDAVTTKRVYRDALLPHEGAEVLMGSAGELDPEFLEIFIRNINFYPVGCRVRLSTGEVGTVKEVYPDIPFRPVVQVNRAEGAGKREINLVRDLTVFITGVIKE